MGEGGGGGEGHCHRLHLLALLAIAAALLLTLAPARPARAAPAEYASFDVRLDLRDDGTFHVTETQVVTFACCSLRLGHRQIPLTRIEAIRNISLTETTDGVRPYTYNPDLTALASRENSFTTLSLGPEVSIYWTFPPTSNQTRTFVLAYDVVGALRVYRDLAPANEQIWWMAVGRDLSRETPVNAATMTVRLPRAVALSDVRLGANGRDDPRQYSSDGQTFTWQHGPFGSGDQFEARLQFPPLVEAAPPSWQAADDAQRARQEAADRDRARRNVLFVAAGLVLVTGGGVGVTGLWYLRGRDPFAALPAEFLPQPPDDLPAGAVGTLLDERADERDVVAALLDLGRRGILTITEKSAPGALGFGAGRDYTVTLAQIPTAGQAAPFERDLLEALFGAPLAAGKTTALGAVKSRFDATVPQIKEGLYGELVRRGYFAASPAETRRRWRRVGIWGVGLALVAGIVLQLAIGGAAIFPALVLAALCGVLIWLAPSMPRKTRQGAEAAAKWRAFRRYLERIDTYEHVGAATAIFDRYLAYAVAFGLDQSWVATFASVDTPAPAWYGDAGGGRSQAGWDLDDLSLPRGVLTTSGGGSSHGGGGVKLGVPNLQKTSDRAGSSLQSSSNGLLSLLSLAFDIFSAFSGGGGRGGSSGGGGGGFR